MSPFLRRIAPGLLLATVALGITLSSRPGKAAPRLLSASDFRGLEDSAIQVKTGEWYYEPKEIGVEASTMVSLTLQHVGSTTIPHDIVFELDGGRKAASNKIRGGESDVLAFVAPAQPGEYVFYCSVGNHRSRGMEGKLIVTAASKVLLVKTGEWYYEPKEIGVESSTVVSLTLQHEGSATIPHDIVFELDGGRKAASNKIRGGETDALGFVAPAEPGEYVFYCSVGNHRSRGMEGKLVVTGPGGVVPTPAATSTTMGPEPTATPLPPTEPPGTDRWSINLPMLFKE